MIGQSDQASNQYGFYAIPKAVEPKKKYRQTYDENQQYEDEEYQDENPYETLQQEPQNQRQLQRDYYVDEAPYPQFKPKQKGLDYGVQIEKQDLFDFDLEVRPIIQILVGRSVVSAINQLQQQKQKQQRDQKLDTYQKKRNAQLMVTQRLQAKSKRKQQQSDRRVLQKQLYVKNKKQATKKLISRKNAKHCLLNMKTQILTELEQDGYLREDTYSRLRVQYESWMYEQIKDIIDEQMRVSNVMQKLVTEKQKQIQGQHQKYIDKENQRRKGILDQREKTRKQNQERKRKKKRRKQRLQLNQQRAPRAQKCSQQLQKYEKVPKILKSSMLTNGLTKSSNTPDSVHISGGLLNFILQFLNSTGENYSEQQVQAYLDKILSQLSSKLVINLSKQDYQKVETTSEKMNTEPIQFMKNKNQNVNNLANQISLDYNLLECSKKLPQQLKKSLLKAILNIFFNCLPQPKMEGQQTVSSYEPTDLDKKRQQKKSKIQIKSQQKSYNDQISEVTDIVRVRFQKIRKQEQQGRQQPQKKQIDLDQWIDIFDGEGWQHDLQNVQKQKQRQDQSPTSYALPSFGNAFVSDERNMHYLCEELKKLLEVKCGQGFQIYIKNLNNIKKPEAKVPVYDAELLWE